MENRNPYQSPTADVSALSNNEGYDESGPFSPSGRFGRLSYLAWHMAMVIPVMILVVALAGVSAAANSPALMSLLVLIYIAMVIPIVIFTIRRLHDFDASGWLTLLMIVPIANIFLSFLLYLKPGTRGANRFAPPRITRGWEKTVGYIAILIPIIGIVAAIAIPSLVHH